MLRDLRKIQDIEELSPKQKKEDEPILNNPGTMLRKNM